MAGRVLVVEDDETVRRLLSDFVRDRCNVEVHAARDGAEALHLLSRNSYSLIVLDVMLPHMTGIDVLDSLEARLGDPSVQKLDRPPAVLVVTGVPAESISSTALYQRFPRLVRGLLPKPVDITTFASMLDGLI